MLLPSVGPHACGGTWLRCPPPQALVTEALLLSTLSTTGDKPDQFMGCLCTSSPPKHRTLEWPNARKKPSHQQYKASIPVLTTSQGIWDATTGQKWLCLEPGSVAVSILGPTPTPVRRVVLLLHESPAKPVMHHRVSLRVKCSIFFQYQSYDKVCRHTLAWMCFLAGVPL